MNLLLKDQEQCAVQQLLVLVGGGEDVSEKMSDLN